MPRGSLLRLTREGMGGSFTATSTSWWALHSSRGQETGGPGRGSWRSQGWEREMRSAFPASTRWKTSSLGDRSGSVSWQAREGAPLTLPSPPTPCAYAPLPSRLCFWRVHCPSGAFRSAPCRAVFCILTSQSRTNDRSRIGAWFWEGVLQG